MTSRPVNPYSRSSINEYFPPHIQVFLIIDAYEARAQRLARLLTLAGYRAVVVPNSYYAFDRFLGGRFVPRAILLGQEDNVPPFVFQRFFQRITLELSKEIPIIPLNDLELLSDHLLYADPSSSTTHIVSRLNVEVLDTIWQISPRSRINLARIEPSIVLDALPELGLEARVGELNHDSRQVFLQSVCFVRQFIPAELWENVLTDVGLSAYCQPEYLIDEHDVSLVPLEYTTCLIKAIVFVNPMNVTQVLSELGEKISYLVMEKKSFRAAYGQLLKFLGAGRRDHVMRLSLNAVTDEMNLQRGEELNFWKRQPDGAYIVVMYSNSIAYGLMGSLQPVCVAVVSALRVILRKMQMEDEWEVSEIECSAQSHTGHCVFLIQPR